jgi:enoyl-CoA hydratase
MSESSPHFIVEHDGPILICTMNRPERRNAFSSEMLVRMFDAWVELSRNPELRVGIVTGADGNFCSGADLKAMAAGGAETQEWADRMKGEAELPWKALLRAYRPTKPLIAAVEGYAVAGGTEILQAMDIRVGAETATFGVAEVRRGLFPLGGSTVRLRRQIPYTLAADLLLTGRFVTAQEAKEIGLIGHVVPERTAGGAGGVALVARDRGNDRGRCARARDGDRPADLRHQGRHGRPARLRREAQAQLQGRVDRLILVPRSLRCPWRRPG